MFTSAAGSLMILDANTSPKVFWKGTQVPVVTLMVIDKKVHLKVTADVALNAVYEDMIASGIRLKEMV